MFVYVLFAGSQSISTNFWAKSTGKCYSRTNRKKCLYRRLQIPTIWNCRRKWYRAWKYQSHYFKILWRFVFWIFNEVKSSFIRTVTWPLRIYNRNIDITVIDLIMLVVFAFMIDERKDVFDVNPLIGWTYILLCKSPDEPWSSPDMKHTFKIMTGIWDWSAYMEK